MSKTINWNNFTKGLIIVLVLSVISFLIYGLIYLWNQDKRTALIAITLPVGLFVCSFCITYILSLIGKYTGYLIDKYKLSQKEKTLENSKAYYEQMIRNHDILSYKAGHFNYTRLIPVGAIYDKYGNIKAVKGQLDCGDEDEDPIYICDIDNIYWIDKK